MTEPPSWILLPGFSQTPSVWDAVARELDQAASTAAIPPGCDARAAAAQLGRDRGRGYWAGYSMGGRIALQVALDYPDRVEHLAIISSTAGILDPAERTARRVEDERLAAAVEQHGVDAFLDEWVGRPLFQGVPEAALKAHRIQSAASIADQLRSLGQGSQPPLWDRLGELSMPVTLVAGARDSKYAGTATAMAAAIPTAEVVLIPDAGHALLQERPEDVARILARVG